VGEQPVETDSHAEARDGVERKRKRDIGQPYAMAPREPHCRPQPGEGSRDDGDRDSHLRSSAGSALSNAAIRERRRSVIFILKASRHHHFPVPNPGSPG
jgi:hypothetical protein